MRSVTRAVVQPSAETIEKSAGATDDGSDIHWILVYLQAHSESHNLCQILEYCFMKEGPFCWTYGILPLANKHVHLILENHSDTDGVSVG